MANALSDDDDDDINVPSLPPLPSILRKRVSLPNENKEPSEDPIEIEIEPESWSEKVLNTLELIQSSNNCDVSKIKLLSSIIADIPSEDRQIILDVEKCANMSFNLPQDYKLVKDQYTNELFKMLGDIDRLASKIKNKRNKNVIILLTKHIEKCYETSILAAISNSKPN